MTDERFKYIISFLIVLFILVVSIAVITISEVTIGKSYIIYNNPRTGFPSEADQPRAETKNEKSVGYGQDNFLPDALDKKPEEVKFLFFGDMMLDRHVGEKIDKYGLDYIFTKLASTSEGSFFSDYDIVGANLEGAVTDDGAHYAPANAYDFAFAPSLIGELKNYGFNFFTIANNHLADQGERGIIETRKNLGELGYFFVGCRDREVGECSTDIIEIENKKIGMAGFSMVYGRMNEDKMRVEVEKISSSSDFTIVNIHWGVEYEHQFNAKQQQVAYDLVEAGADLIIGHHPHVVQGVETYMNKPIFYSLGNFIFDQYFSSDTQEGLAIGVYLGESSLGLNLFPLTSKASQVELMKGDEKDVFFKKFLKWSKVDGSFKEEINTGKIIINYE